MSLRENKIMSFDELPRRLLLDTCILNRLYDEGYYIWEGELPDNLAENEIDAESRALRNIFSINERASFQFVVSPLSIAEVANVQDFHDRERRLHWVLDVLDHWLIMLDEVLDRKNQGGSVRHRFKLNSELQQLESTLMGIQDFKRDPFDRLLLIQHKMANCDSFLTIDEDTIWRHRKELLSMGIHVLRPSEFWELLRPYSALWR